MKRWLADVREHLKARPARVAAVGGALAVGMALGVPFEEAAFTYTWVDPAFCNDCHVHDYANEAYDRSVHAGLTTCHDCHLVPIRHYPRNLWLMLTDPPQGPEDIHAPEVEAVVCAQCHAEGGDHGPLTGPMGESVRKLTVKIDGSELHMRHLNAESRDPGAARGGDGSAGDGDITCMDCHGAESNRAHAFAATSENCLSCHKELDHGTHGMERLECRECHFQGFVGWPGAAQ
jgi:hypothetical protein